MTDGTSEGRTWEDSGGTEWRVRRRDEGGGDRPGWVLTCVHYTFVTFAQSPEAPTAEQLQRYVDRHGREDAEPGASARLWTDPRSREEWEVYREAGELVFRRGTDVIRAPAGDGQPSIRSMDDAALQGALDRAQSGG